MLGAEPRERHGLERRPARRQGRARGPHRRAPGLELRDRDLHAALRRLHAPLRLEHRAEAHARGRLLGLRPQQLGAHDLEVGARAGDRILRAPHVVHRGVELEPATDRPAPAHADHAERAGSDAGGRDPPPLCDECEHHGVHASMLGAAVLIAQGAAPPADACDCGNRQRKRHLLCAEHTHPSCIAA